MRSWIRAKPCAAWRGRSRCGRRAENEEREPPNLIGELDESRNRLSRAVLRKYRLIRGISRRRSKLLDHPIDEPAVVTVEPAAG